MSKMKEIFTNKCDELAITLYGKDFYELDKDQQDVICKKAENALEDYVSNQIDVERERRKYA